MEKRFKIYLIISLIIHIIIVTLFTYITNRYKIKKIRRSNNINLNIIKIDKNYKKEIKKNFKKELNIENKYIQEKINKFIPEKQFELNIEEKKYTLSFNYSSKVNNIKNKNFFQDENLNNYNFEIQKRNNEQITSDGKKRKLEIYDLNELKNFQIDILTKCKIKIKINKSGYILNIDFIESSGIFETDEKIKEIISKWKFEESELEIQEIIININYLVNN